MRILDFIPNNVENIGKSSGFHYVIKVYLSVNVCPYSYDGIPFLMRDSTLTRTTNVAEVFPNRTHLHASMFSWADLQQLNAGDWFLLVRRSHTHVGASKRYIWLKSGTNKHRQRKHCFTNGCNVAFRPVQSAQMLLKIPT